MVDQLNAFASEVTRVAREVGTEGKLGGQAEVRGVAGTWKDLTDNVNSMADNLTTQVRNIADVTTAVARGDLSKKITVEVRGEILELKDTINTMVDQLNAFASEVTRVAREVGTEGQLGGQADVRGVGGTWKDLTDSVNHLAANLTTQVRAIGEVATAVTRGDLSRSVQVEAQGEVELLKDHVNEMIRNLRETTRRNQEVDWLKTNIARFGQMLQGQRDLRNVARLILTELAPLVGVQRGVFYLADLDGEPSRLGLLATYPRQLRPEPAARIKFGEGLLGQCAEDRRRIVLRDVPPDYAPINSALGGATPRSIVLLPILFEDETRAVIELASVEDLSEIHLAFLDQLAESIGIVLSTITANMRAEDLVQEQAARVEAEYGLARLRQVVDVMPEAILIADATGRVYLSNAAAAEIMGAVPETVTLEADGAMSARRVDGAAYIPADHPLARAVFHSEVVRGEQLMITNALTGKDVPILVNSAPLSDGQGHPAGGVAVFQDISPLRDLDRQKDEFLAAISHDLKTPATIIKGNANLLQRALSRADRNGSGQISEGLEVIDESTGQLVRLVDELLDLTRLRMGHELELDVGPADLIKIVRRLATEYQKISPRHTIQFDSDDPAGRRRLGRGPDRADRRQPHLECREVQPEGRRHRDPRDPGATRPGVVGGPRRPGQRDRHPAGRDRPRLRAVLPGVEHRGHRQRQRHRPCRDAAHRRAARRGHHRRERGGRHDVHRSPAADPGAPRDPRGLSPASMPLRFRAGDWSGTPVASRNGRMTMVGEAAVADDRRDERTAVHARRFDWSQPCSHLRWPSRGSAIGARRGSQRRSRRSSLSSRSSSRSASPERSSSV